MTSVYYLEIWNIRRLQDSQHVLNHRDRLSYQSLPTIEAVISKFAGIKILAIEDKLILQLQAPDESS